MMHVEFERRPEWPGLAWVARCERGKSHVVVAHGPRVEVRPAFFCEAVWDGEFAEGNFDRTDIVAGSGGRVRDDRVVFVSSGSTVDRLQSIDLGNHVLVSNSLACLCAACGATVDPTYRDYERDASTVIEGLDRYKRTLRTSAGDVHLTYFDNLEWDGSRLEVRAKPGPARDFSTFAGYRGFLHRSMDAIVRNAGDAARRQPFDLLGSLSSGYDSTAVTVLARECGLREVITFDRARGGDDDSGEQAARLLGLDVHKVSREAWRQTPFVEVPFVASYSSSEDIAFQGAEPYLAGRVFFTGYHGDKIWDPHTTYLSDKIVRGDPSGLSLCEYRLDVGFINCPVPFWGVRQIADVNALAKSDEMRPWNVPGDYNRPIPRRIGEEAGLPRNMFGVRKRAVSFNVSATKSLMSADHMLLTRDSLQDYLAWLRDHRAAWSRAHKLPPIASAQLNYWINRAHMQSVDTFNAVSRLPGAWRVLRTRSYQPRYLNCYLFPWALDRAVRRYVRGGAHAMYRDHGVRDDHAYASPRAA